MEGNTTRSAPTVILGHATEPAAVSGAALPGPGSVLGPYTITERIGEGGMGVVFRAEDRLLDRPVALKILPPHLFRDPEYLERFRIEARAQARLQSPNVVTLHTMLEDPAGLVLVMEYVEGETLEQRIRARGPLAIDDAIDIFIQALRGVGEAHRLGIVHRDLKPGNIFLTREGGVKIMDFGVAKLADRRDLTSAGSRLGTLLYLSPEQVKGETVDARSDIYTLGIGLFEALTGRVPFRHDGDYALMRAHLEEPPPRPTDLRPDLPAALEAVVLKSIEKRPERRFQDAAAFREALARGARKVRGFLNLNPAAARASPAKPVADPMRLAMPKRLLARRTLLGHLGFDLLLLAAIVGLVLFLGLYPRSKPDADASAAAAAQEKARASGAPAVPAARAPAPPTAKPPAAGPPKDKYEDLRKAWGGG